MKEKLLNILLTAKNFVVEHFIGVSVGAIAVIGATVVVIVGVNNGSINLAMSYKDDTRTTTANAEVDLLLSNKTITETTTTIEEHVISITLPDLVTTVTVEDIKSETQKKETENKTEPTRFIPPPVVNEPEEVDKPQTTTTVATKLPQPQPTTTRTTADKDPWVYPYDLNTIYRECEEYAISLGTIYDHTLDLTNSHWITPLSTVPVTLGQVSTPLKEKVFEGIKYNHDEGFKVIKIYFEARTDKPGDYWIYHLVG